MTEESKPALVVTAILDESARPAAVTMSHGDAMERAIHATAGKPIADLDLVELPVPSKVHAALRKKLGLGADVVGVYDIFPLAAHLDAPVRRAAAQFLAAEALWSLDVDGIAVPLDLPQGWDKDPKAIHNKLVEAGALELGDDAIATFNEVKAQWS